MTDTIKTDRSGTVFRITLNRPDVLNSFDEEMGAGFLDALREGSDSSVRCVVITGAGKGFCAGEDLRALSGDYEKGKAPDLGDILRRRYIPAIQKIRQLQKPVIAAVNGVAAGAGVSLALACDYRVMADGAALVLAFVSAGLIPDAGGTWLLPKYLGVGRSLELAMTGGKVTAERAHELGLVSDVVGEQEFESHVEKLSRSFATGPTVAYGLMKDLIWKAAGGYLETHLEAEAEAQSRAGETTDHMEGVRAFLDKRPAKFDGK